MAERRDSVSFPVGSEVSIVTEPEPLPAPVTSEPFLDTGLKSVALNTNGYLVNDARELVGIAPYQSRTLDEIRLLSIHHSASAAPETIAGERASLLSIARFHRETRQWPGFAYHFAIGPSGAVYWTGDILTSRYVVGKGNRSNLAICYLGNFTYELPTRAAILSGRRLVQELRFGLGWAVPGVPHRNVPGTEPTACPGDRWQEWVPEVLGDTAAPVGVIPAPEASDPGSELEEDYARVIDAAHRFEVSERAALALVIAESGLHRRARRPGDPAWDSGYWPDVSGGLCQQTVAWSDELRAKGLSWRVYPGPEITAEILAAYYDPDYALSVGIPKLKRYVDAAGDDLNGLCLYNAPAGDPGENPNRGNYERALGIADRILAGEPLRGMLY